MVHCLGISMWIIYWTYIVFALIFVLSRIGSLTAHSAERAEITAFPEACSEWAAERGCTRIVAAKDGCVKELEIPEEFNIGFKSDM